jgi:hypothetical protein
LSSRRETFDESIQHGKLKALIFLADLLGPMLDFFGGKSIRFSLLLNESGDSGYGARSE